MTEKQLNENIIRNKMQGVCQDCMYLDKIVPIINQMLNEQYIKGLEQGKLDKEMGKQRIIDFIKDKNEKNSETIKFHMQNTNDYFKLLKLCGKYEAYKEILDFARGDKDE